MFIFVNFQSECSSYFRDLQSLMDSFKKKGSNKEKLLEEIQRKVELAKGFATVKANTKPCPHCGVPIQKISGYT